ncbi:MAG TPA: DUF3037 domain-containing protein [Flavobacterium sp.]|jgi:hypothetical protein
MQEQHLYEYAVIRVVPRVEREEFLNVGIIMFCKRKKFLVASCNIDAEKLLLLAPDCEMELIQSNLTAIEKICAGSKDGGPIASMDTPERFRWLTAIRSSVIQTSRPHPGLSGDLEGTVKRLVAELVL